MVQKHCLTMDDKRNFENDSLINGNSEGICKFPAQQFAGHYKLHEREWSPLSSQRSISNPILNANKETSFINHQTTSKDYEINTDEQNIEGDDCDDITEWELTSGINGHTDNKGTSTAKRPQNVPGIQSHKRLKSTADLESTCIIADVLDERNKGLQQSINTSSAVEANCCMVEALPFDGEDMLSNPGSQHNEVINDENEAEIEQSPVNQAVDNPSPQQRQGTTRQYKRTDFGDYYPDGGWGWVVCIGAAIVHFFIFGIHYAGGSMYVAVSRQFKADVGFKDWLCSVSFGLCHVIAPFVVAWCRRHSPRLLALAGALASGLGYLFMSFSTETHQVFACYSIFFAISSGILIHTSSVMIGRFFHCRRDCVEITCLSVSGIGMVALTNYIQFFVNVIPWSRGTQLLGCAMILVIASVATYRSTALYHPRRRAIVHLKRTKKTQRQLKDFENKPSYWDVSPLLMCSFRILLICAFFTGLGYYVPFVLLPTECEKDKFDQHAKLVTLSFLGISHTLGVSSCGLLVLRSSQKCLVAKQYLCLTSGCMCGITTMLFAMAHGIKAYILFVVVFGLSSGAFMYSLKLYVIELVTRRLAEMALAYMYACLGLGILIGTPAFLLLSTKVIYIRASFIAAGICMLLGSGLLFVITLTANHPSNHRVIKSAYLKTKMAEEEVLFDEMNISNSEDSVLSDSDGFEESKSPSIHWSEYGEGSLTSVSDKVTTYFPDDEDGGGGNFRQSMSSFPDSPLQQFCQKDHSETQFGVAVVTQTHEYRDPPPKYGQIEDLIVERAEEGTTQQTLSASVIESTRLVQAHTTLAPAKSTYV